MLLQVMRNIDEDINRLTDILSAELAGEWYDHTEVQFLVERLMPKCPEIAQSLSNIARRMAVPPLAKCG